MIFFVLGGAGGGQLGAEIAMLCFIFLLKGAGGLGGRLGAEIAMIRRQVAGCQLKLDKVPA